jgi:outer membrane protein assembly factor BamB
MQVKRKKPFILLFALFAVFLTSTCLQAQAAAGKTAPKNSKPILSGEGISITYNYSGGKLTGYNLNDYLKNNGASGNIKLKVAVKSSNGTEILSKTKTFAVKAGKKYHVSFDAGFLAGDTREASYVIISSSNMDGSDQYELKKTLIVSIGDIKVEEVENNANMAKLEVYEGKQLLKLDGKGESNYAAYVGSDTASVDVAAAAEDPDAMVSINKTTARSSLKKTIALKKGENTVTVKVTAPDGTTSSTSVIKITRSSGIAAKKWVKSYSAVSGLAVDKSGVIYAGVSEDAKSYLLALNPDGTEKWRYSASSSVGTPAVGADGTIYAPCKTKIIAVTPEGKIRWQYDTDSDINKKIVVGKDKNIYFGVFAGYTDEQLFALKPDGKKLWTFKTGSVYSEFVVGEDGSVYYTTWDMQKGDNGYMLHALNADRSGKWEYAISGLPNDLITGKDGVLLLTLNKTLLAVDAEKGTKKWEAAFDKSLNHAAVGSDGTIYAGSSGVLYATDFNGSSKWETKLGEDLYGMRISSDGTVYISSADHKVYGVDVKGGKKQEFLMTGVSYYAPAISDDGSVYVSTDDNKIFAFGK